MRSMMATRRARPGSAIPFGDDKHVSGAECVDGLLELRTALGVPRRPADLSNSSQRSCLSSGQNGAGLLPARRHTPRQSPTERVSSAHLLCGGDSPYPESWLLLIRDEGGTDDDARIRSKCPKVTELRVDAQEQEAVTAEIIGLLNRRGVFDADTILMIGMTIITWGLSVARRDHSARRRSAGEPQRHNASAVSN